MTTIDTTFNGFKRQTDYTGATVAIQGGGQNRMDIGNATLTTVGGASSALLHGLGNSTTRSVTGTASAKFISYYTEGNADGIYGVYFRHYVSTAAVGNDCLRAFATVNNVAASTVRGAHISLSFATSGTVTGLGCALEATLHVPSAGAMAGTNYAIKAAINSDAAASDPAGATTIACIGLVSQGDATGAADVDTDAALFDVSGFAAAAGTTNVVSSTSLAELPANVGLRVKVNGALYYIPAVAVAGWN